MANDSKEWGQLTPLLAQFHAALSLTQDSLAKLLKASDTQIPQEVASGARLVFDADLLTAWLDRTHRLVASVGFADLRGMRATPQVFVPPSGIRQPSSIDAPPNEVLDLASAIAADVEAKRSVVLLGGPGSGKTMLAKALVGRLLDAPAAPRIPLPLLLLGRDLESMGSSGVVLSTVARTLGLRIELPPVLEAEISQVARAGFEHSAYLALLSAAGVVLVIDGIDEVPRATSSTAGREVLSRRSLEQELFELAERIQGSSSSLFVTCRSGDWTSFHPALAAYEIASFTDSQVAGFAERWLQSPQAASRFLEQLRRSPFADTALRPLSLAHLAAIYERIGDLPSKPKTVYRKIVSLLLEDWDAQRAITRQSSYAALDPDRKFDFLSHLAYELTANRRLGSFDAEDLSRAFLKLAPAFALPPWEAAQVVRELESHSGLLVETAYGRYEFPHRSIQEFLTAEYIVRLPALSLLRQAAPYLPNELAISTALSSNPIDYLEEAALSVLCRVDLSESFAQTFVSRLLIEKPDLRDDKGQFGLVALLLRALGSEAEDLFRLFGAMSAQNVVRSVLRRFTVTLSGAGMTLHARPGETAGSAPFLYVIPASRYLLDAKTLSAAFEWSDN